MKKLLFLVSAAVAGVSVLAEQADHWTFDGETITDNEWTFAATVKSDTELTVGDYSQYPASGILNFAKPVKDAVGTIYTIVTLNPHLCSGTDYRWPSETDASRAVTELYLPATGLTEISGGAFGKMPNCTKVEPFIPDSVVTLGEGAFYSVACAQDLRLVGVCGTIGRGTFTASKITSVVFGPGLKTIYDWGYGPFINCSALTNVTFDAAMTGARFQGATGGGFCNCTALVGTVDLSGFSDLSYVGTTGGNVRTFENTAVSKIILGSGLEKLDVNFFDRMPRLEEVVFNSTPQDFTFTTNISGGCMFGGIPATQGVIARIREADTNAWKFLAKDGVINADDSTFSEEFAGSNYAARYLLTDGKSSGGGEIGYWVYDADARCISCELGWKFNASRSVNFLSVGTCVAYPDEVSLLDFSAKVTDADGKELQINIIDTVFATGDTRWPTQTDAGQKVGELRLPETGLTTLGHAAFARCNNLTNIVNYIPDSVTSIGEAVFYCVPAKVDLRLHGVKKVDRAAFCSSGITSVTFGPDLEQLRTYATSCFGDCKNLTNVTFDAAMSGAKFTGSAMSHFAGCSKLAGTIDLSGFSNLNDFSQGGDGAFKGTLVEKVILGAGLTTINAKFLGGMTKLSEVVFQGEPPATIGTPYLNGNPATQKITTWVHKKDKAAWAPYATNGQLRHKGTTWSADYLAEGIDLSMRPLLVADMIDGLMLLVR